MEILQQRPSLLLSSVHLILQILQIDRFNSSVHVHNFLWFLFHLSPLYRQHSALLSHNCLLSPLSMTSSRSPPPAALADTQTTGNKNEISHYQRLISKRYLTFNERFTFNAIAYQFFAGSRLHVVGIRISVLQCVTTLWREQTDSVSMWKHRPLCVNICACRIELQYESK